MGDPRTRTDGATIADRATPTAAAALAAGLMLAAGHAAAQQAMVVVSHNDPNGIVSPGETVRISTILAWTAPAPALREIRGSVHASPDVGTAANNSFPYAIPPSSWYITDPGLAVGGSILDVHVLYTELSWWLFQTPPAWPFLLWSGIEIVRYDWTAPLTPGLVNFDFVPDPLLPLPTFTPVSTTTPTSYPTTLIGTSLTVIPAPASAAVLGLEALALGRRRRAR